MVKESISEIRVIVGLFVILSVLSNIKQEDNFEIAFGKEMLYSSIIIQNNKGILLSLISLSIISSCHNPVAF
jgi:hypothetical protein